MIDTEVFEKSVKRVLALPLALRGRRHFSIMVIKQCCALKRFLKPDRHFEKKNTKVHLVLHQSLFTAKIRENAYRSIIVFVRFKHCL